jgi:hypothetical protein
MVYKPRATTKAPTRQKHNKTKPAKLEIILLNRQSTPETSLNADGNQNKEQQIKQKQKPTRDNVYPTTRCISKSQPQK